MLVVVVVVVVVVVMVVVVGGDVESLLGETCKEQQRSRKQCTSKDGTERKERTRVNLVTVTTKGLVTVGLERGTIIFGRIY